MKKTPEELAAKKQRDNLRGLCNRIASAFSFKTVKTWGDVYRMEGIPPESMPSNSTSAVIYPDLKAHFAALQEKLEQNLKSPSVQSPVVSLAVTKEEPVKQELTLVASIELAKLDTHNADDDYGFVRSPKESKEFNAYWFQKKAIVELTNGILKEGKRGQCLLSSTGTGKTFIAGGLVRRLVDAKFADDKTYGAVKYLYVTRSTIVEQTKRVFEKFFNLGIKDGVEILNIEQLRSRAGAIWVKETMNIVDGKEYWNWEWRKMLQPVVILLDECQAVKNEESSQSKIIQAYADIPGKNTYVVFISATPFTRVSEAKSFVLNCHITDDEFVLV